MIEELGKISLDNEFWLKYKTCGKMKKLDIRYMTEEEVMEYLIKISNEKK